MESVLASTTTECQFTRFRPTCRKEANEAGVRGQIEHSLAQSLGRMAKNGATFRIQTTKERVTCFESGTYGD